MANNIEFDTNKKFLDYDGLKTYHAKLMEFLTGQGNIQFNDLVIVKGDADNSAVLKNSDSIASGKYSIALGSGVHATGNYSFAEGKGTQATNTSAHAEGYETFATGKYSHSEGIGATASGEGSHAEGGYYVGGVGIFRGGQASGRSSHAEGYDTTASGESSHAEGVKTVALGSGSHAEGGYFIDSYNSVAGGRAEGRSSHAEGVNTVAHGDMSHVEGFDVVALGKYSHAEGGSEQEIKVFMPRLTPVNGEKCKYKTDLTQIPNNDPKFLVGNWVANIHYINDSGEIVYDPQTSIKITSVINSTSIYIVTDKEIVGYPNESGGFDKLNNTPVLFVKYVDKPTDGNISYTVTAAGDASHAEGSEGTKSAGFASHAEGCHTFAGGTYSHSEGVETEARGFASHTEGNLSVTGTYAAFSHAEGSGTKALGARSHAEGVDTIALGEDSHAEGDNTQSIGNNSHAEGSGTTAIGFQSHAEGLNSEASGTSAHAEGYGTFAKGARSHAEGRGTYAYSQECHAEGWNTKAGIENNPEVNAAHAEGKETEASGRYSHAEGLSTLASGQSSHAEGDSTTAYGYSSHTEGASTNASGNYSHAEGLSTTASGDGSHAEGYDTLASSDYSHAEGFGTTASGRYSHAGGYHTIASKDAEFATGKYNKSNANTLFSVGNGTGTSNANRKNAFEVTSSKAFVHGKQIATLNDIPTSITIDTELNPDSNNPIANSAVANAIKGGVHFIGTTSQLPWEGLQNTTIGQSLDGADTKEYNIGDIIIVSDGGNEQGFNEPTKEYILAYGNESEDNGDVIHGYRWVELGDVTPAQSMINESLKNYYKKSEIDSKFSNYVRNSSGDDGIISIENSGNEWDDINGTINISTSYDYDGYTTGLVQSSNIELEGSQIKLTVNDELENGKVDNTFKLNKNGLTYNDSPIVTVANTDELNVLKTDERGVVNKSELSIGNFEIKNDKQYNYTLEGIFDNGDDRIVIEASYDGEPAQLMTVYPYDYSGGDETDWCYKFIVTSEHGDMTSDYLYIPAALIDGDYKSEYYSLLNFTEDVSETFSIYTSHDGERPLSNAKITRTVPFSLRHTSKALLNGSPVITAQTLAESDVVSGLDKKIVDEINRAKDAEATLTANVNNKADITYVDENFIKNKSDNNYDIVIGSDAGVDITGMYYDGADTVTCECKLGENAGGVEISTHNEAIPSKGKITVKGDDIIMAIEDYRDNLDVADCHKVSLNNNGFTYNDSPIITPANADELNILKTDEDGVVNKSELSIGSFVIKDDKPFNYTLSGSIQNDYYSISFVAEYNKESAKYVEQGWYDYYYEQEGVYQGYVYTFVITEATSSDEYESPSESYIGQEITVPAYMIDSDYGDYYEETRTGDFYVKHLDFSESNSHVITLPYCELQNYESETYWPLTCTITESAPFALKKASKATLNGKPIVTNDILANTESNIIKDVNKKLENFVSASKSATSSISLDESGESYNTIKSITSFSNGGTYLKMGYTHDVLDVEGSDVQEQQTSSITNNKDGIIMSNERRGLNTDLWSGFVDADKSQVKVSDDSISFIVEDYEVTYNDSGEPDSYIVRPKTVKLDKTSFTYNNKQIATVDQLVTPLTPSQLNELTNLFE